jgi:hypothetical protein
LFSKFQAAVVIAEDVHDLDPLSASSSEDVVQVHDTSAKVVRSVNMESARPQNRSSSPGANVLKVGDILKINSQRLS